MGTYGVKNKHVVITGASSGIGRALSECFAREGAILHLGCHPKEKAALGAWAGELVRRYGVRAHTYPVDLSLDRGPGLLFARVQKNAPVADVLVNNAGVIAYGNFHELSLEKQEAIVRINALAYLKLMRLFLPGMVRAGEGRVLNVVSAAAFQPTVHQAVYGAAKAMVQSLSEAVGQELRGTGVRICTLNPSYTDTPLLGEKNFPERIWWYAVSGLGDPAVVARKGFKAFKRGRAVYIPGPFNFLVHSLLPRLLPRGLVGLISYYVLKERKAGSRA
jgi:uncharacterized protein